MEFQLKLQSKIKEKHKYTDHQSSIILKNCVNNSLLIFTNFEF